VTATGSSAQVATLLLSANGATFSVQAASGWLTQSDGDMGDSANYGFYHQELTAPGGGVTDLSVSDKFKLPRGTACGFHHTKNTPFNPNRGHQSTCMGQDPAYGQCPVGWVAKSQFDMSSGDGTAACGNLQNESHCGYFVWCEYQDPHGLCDGDPACAATARANGYAVGISSDSDASGVEVGGPLVATQPAAPGAVACPDGFARTGFYDDGRPSGFGLSWCLPIPDLPQGLTAGIAYLAPGPTVVGGAAYGARTPYANGDGFATRSDGDRGQPSGFGFYHQELVSGGVRDLSRSASFALLPGTACGFHHTLNDPGLGCMGLDPASSCPSGWTPRRHFDMSSGNGYFVWCEYQDPNGTCAFPNTSDCQANQRYIGANAGISSNTDAAGAAIANGGACPVSWTRAPFFDDGRSSGQGLSFCMP
jgi:hypothetical protein